MKLLHTVYIHSSLTFILAASWAAPRLFLDIGTVHGWPHTADRTKRVLQLNSHKIVLYNVTAMKQSESSLNFHWKYKNRKHHSGHLHMINVCAGIFQNGIWDVLKDVVAWKRQANVPYEYNPEAIWGKQVSGIQTCFLNSSHHIVLIKKDRQQHWSPNWISLFLHHLPWIPWVLVRYLTLLFMIKTMI